MSDNKQNADRDTTLDSSKRSLPWWKRILFISALIIFFVIILESSFYFIIARNFPDYEKIRLGLLGGKGYIAQAYNMIGQPYLLYIPAPGFKNEYGLQHNNLGWRGEPVPFQHRDGYLRVLCMGGSTTYGYGVHKPDETYPAYLQKFLSDALKEEYKGVEVINAGIPCGTSAELMTHYLFKYRYYRPDVLIINTGGNDGSVVSAERYRDYQPDYSHCREELRTIHPLNSSISWIMHSRVIAFYVIHFFYRDLTGGGTFVRMGSPLIKWYPMVKTGEDRIMSVPARDNAFTNNLKTVIHEALQDGTHIILLPFRENPFDHKYMYKSELKAYRQCENILSSLAVEYGVAFAPFPSSVLESRNMWVDNCHLNAEGNKEKARSLIPYILAELQKHRSSPVGKELHSSSSSSPLNKP